MKTEATKSQMKSHLVSAILMTAVGTVLLGIVYPLAVTGIAQLLMPAKANGQLISLNGELVGSRILGQPFKGPKYFHSRPSASGDAGYDATASGGSNYGPTNQKLVDRVAGDVASAQADHPGMPVPIDLVTASASGLDPDISPAAAEFQVVRVARERGLSEAAVRQLVQIHIAPPQFGLLGESRVNVLALNLALDEQASMRH